MKRAAEMTETEIEAMASEAQAMTIKPTREILLAMGFKLPEGIKSPSLLSEPPDLAIVDYGNVLGFVCKTPEIFNLIANRGGITYRKAHAYVAREWHRLDNVITVTRYKAVQILAEIARARLENKDLRAIDEFSPSLEIDIARRAIATVKQWLESFPRVSQLEADQAGDFYRLSTDGKASPSHSVCHSATA